MVKTIFFTFIHSGNKKINYFTPKRTIRNCNKESTVNYFTLRWRKSRYSTKTIVYVYNSNSVCFIKIIQSARNGNI